MMARKNTLKGLIALGVLIGLSCTLSIFPLNSRNEVKKNITASLGGELTLPDQTVLKIPAGSLRSDTQVTLSEVDSQDTPTSSAETTKVGGIYEINLGSTSLSKPATLAIPFDQTLLPEGSEAGQVFLTYYDESKMEWVYAGGVVDTVRNVVVLEISHASLWRPATWNWSAWIAVLDKLLSVSVVDFVEAVQLLTNDCPQSGNYVQVDSSQALNLIQGCVDVDDSQQPQLRIVNPKSFFYEIKTISGGNGYPAPSLLGPGDEVKFEASTSDPSPLVIQAEMAQKSGWYLVIHMVITMLPGANQFGIQPSSVACITERLADVSDIASAVESLLNNDGAAAAESIHNFMIDGDKVRRFLTAADDCNFGPSPTWSVEGIKQIGGAVSTIMSATDYIANYFAGNNYAQVSFIWSPLVDMTNAESIVSWINQGFQHGDASVFNNLITMMPNFWAIFMPDCWGDNCPSYCDMVGKYCDITKAEFIHEIENRIQSKPQCAYLAGKNITLVVETFGWNPLWTWPIGEANFVQFYFSQEFVGAEYRLTEVDFVKDIEFPWLADTPCP
jgi:hypothetical protein